jgi:hypothetical protein
MLFDTRDNTLNPFRGQYLLARIRTSPTWLGSDTTWHSLYLDGRIYVPISDRDVLAFWASAWLNFGPTPYLLLPSIGSSPANRTGRGYIEGRHVGQAMVYGEVEWRFHIWEFLGGIAAANIHSVSEPGAQGQAEDQPRFIFWNPAFVAGLRAMISRASLQNLTLDFGVTPSGSTGVYLNVNETF